MPAPTKPFTSIPDASVDGDSPLDATLMTALRDNLQHLKEWLGHSFTAAQDHNHDGVNSAAIEVGPNLLRNGSFESDGTGWTTTAFTGGSISFDTANDMDGAKALAITSTVLANGGGDALSSAYVAATGGGELMVKFSVKGSVANLSSKVEVLWYDDALGSISTSVLWTSAATNTTARKRARIAAAPSNARFARVKVTGGIPATGSATGTVYFDGVSLTEPSGALVLLDELTASTSASLNFVDGFNPDAFARYELRFDRIVPATNGAELWYRLSADGGSTWLSGAASYSYAYSGYESGGAALTGASAADTKSVVTTGGISSTATFGGISGEISVIRPDVTDNVMTKFSVAWAEGTDNRFTNGFSITADINLAFNGIQLLMSTGNIASGTARLYGIRKGV